MEYKNDWHKSKERLKAFWERELIDRCCVSVVSPKENCRYTPGPIISNPNDKLRFWTDGEWILKRYLNHFENTFFGGEAFPHVFLNLGAAGHAGYFKGTRFQFEDTVWFHSFIHDWSKNPLVFDPDSFLYRKTIELAHFLARESSGRFFISMPDISGNSDALAHIRGSENLLVDMLVDKDIVHHSLNKIQEVWLKVNEEVYKIVEANNEGGSSIGWLNTWAPGRHSQMQSDLSVMISPQLFEEFIMPELKNQTNWMNKSLYHFDGMEQIKHLDMLLSLKGLSAIQWTCVEGQPSPLNFLPVLKKIQNAGKCLVIITKPEELEALMDNLSSRGLYLLLYVESKDEAESIIKKVEKLTHD